MSGADLRQDESHLCSLSVVVVTYNEEDRIEECLDSIFDVCSGVTKFQVILVDSNSTDRTVEKAAEYPITICQLPTEAPSTPGAGRYVGFRLATGENVLFVDGDMVLLGSWLDRAIRILETTGVAAIDGHINRRQTNVEDTIEKVDYVSGVALYDGEVLRSGPGFDPFMQSVEDIHLGYRLTNAGFTLLRLPEVFARHPQRGTLSEPIRRLRQGYSIGSGQAIRRSIRSPKILAKHLVRIRYRVLLFFWCCIGLYATRSSRLANRLWLLGSVAGTTVVIRKRGILGGIAFGVQKVIALIGLIVGFSKPPKPPTTFPFDRVKIVQRGPVHGIDC